MSTPGSPGGRQIYSKPTPPERGSFPLDHDNECRHIMTSYLSCLKSHRGTNSNECRLLSKAYLQCRMDNNLMLPDEMRNLGFQESATEERGSVQGAKEGKIVREQEELREMAGRSREGG